jgi:hypothetical protein
MPWPAPASLRATAALLAAAAFAAAAGAAVPANAPAAVVSLRVESSSAGEPLFDGPVDTDPHAVDGGDGSGPHPCWGPPGATPAPTPTGALDDALSGAGISWRGNWDPGFRDFFIDRIGPFASEPPDSYWSLTVNGRFSAGGCLATVTDGDAVRFFYGPLYGRPPEDGAGAPDDPQAEGGGSGSGRLPPAVGRAEPARLARRASVFLRGADGLGGEWAELALALRARRTPAGEARRLGERLRALPGEGAAGPDVDSAALAAWALAMRGRFGQARWAALFVRSAQAADGGFPTMPGGDSNAQSTGVALVALRVAGLGPRPTAVPGGPTPLDYLASLARRDGSIAYTSSRDPTPVWTTAQALLGLTTKAKLMQLDTLRQDDDRTTDGRENQAGRWTQGPR